MICRMKDRLAFMVIYWRCLIGLMDLEVLDRI